VTGMRILSPRLPYRTRARLRAVGWIDRIGCMLVEHGHLRAAEWWWRACRLW